MAVSSLSQAGPILNQSGPWTRMCFGNRAAGNTESRPASKKLDLN